MTYLEKLQARKQEIAEANNRRLETAKLQLLENDNYISTLVNRDNRQANLVKLNSIIQALNEIPAVRLGQTSEEARIQCYPIGTSDFGSEIASLLGIATACTSAYVDEHKFACEAYTTSLVLQEDVVHSFGRPAYWSKRTFTLTPATEATNLEAVKQCLQDLADSLGLAPIDFSKLTPQSYSTYFKREKLKAEQKQAEHNLAIAMDSNSSFTLV
jgi:hypothetical protein